MTDTLYQVYCPTVMCAPRRGIPLGVAYHPAWECSDYTAIVLAYYQSLTPEMACCYFHVAKYGWGDMDYTVQFAQAHGLKIHYAHLRWWFGEQPDDPLAWISEAMERYPTIRDWTVVNEGFWDGNPTIPLIDESYQLARKVRKDARLFYNGLFIQSSECDKILGMIDAKLVDAVGIQCHHDMSSYADRYIPFICDLRERGIPWRVSELDVEIPTMDETCLRVQAERYADVARVVREYDGESISVWGVSDNVSWLPGYPLPFDKDYRPKPAWEALSEQ
jgi:endo-1,4-beta-xylanase